MEEDMISQLPDDILISIMTPFSTKEAVRTSILSKSWRNIYKYVPSISISCPCRRSRLDCDFEVTIDGLHSLSQLHFGLIRSFKFCCCLTQSYSHAFEESMQSLGKCIEKLHLQFSELFDFVFPCDLLSHMPCLKYFKLRYCLLQPNFSSHCNSLKTLRLSKVKVAPGSLECILSNCLSLNTLLIRFCEMPSKLCLRVPQLKCIMIYDWTSDIDQIVLHASNLITFEFFSVQNVDILFESVPQLQHIYLVSFKYIQTLEKDMLHLKSIHLHFTERLWFEELWSDEVILKDIICKGHILFNNVKRLELGVDLECACEDDALSLMPLLQSCPVLQELNLAVRGYMKCSRVEKSVVVHRELKKVDISGFSDQCELVWYILKCAVALQELHISWYYNQYNGFGQWEARANPPCIEQHMVLVYGYIRAMEAQAVSKTVQVMLEKFPRIKSKQDDIWADNSS